MDSENLCLNFLSQESFIVVPTVLIEYFKEDKDSIFILLHLMNQHKYLKSTNQLDSCGFFYSTVESLYSQYYINDYAQRKSVKVLEDLNLITTVKRGMPAKRYFKVNFGEVERVLKGTPSYFRKKVNKKEYYEVFNTGIELGWETFKKSIDNMNGNTAFSCYVWKGLFDKKFSPILNWKWDSDSVGIIGHWVRSEQKAGNIDYSHFIDYFNTIDIKDTNLVMIKKFIHWFKGVPDKPLDRRLQDSKEIIQMIEGNV